MSSPLSEKQARSVSPGQADLFILLQKPSLMSALEEIKAGTEFPACLGYLGPVTLVTIILTRDLVGHDRGLCDRLEFAVSPEVQIFKGLHAHVCCKSAAAVHLLGAEEPYALFFHPFAYREVAKRRIADTCCLKLGLRVIRNKNRKR